MGSRPSSGRHTEISVNICALSVGFPKYLEGGRPTVIFKSTLARGPRRNFTAWSVRWRRMAVVGVGGALSWAGAGRWYARSIYLTRSISTRSSMVSRLARCRTVMVDDVGWPPKIARRHLSWPPSRSLMSFFEKCGNGWPILKAGLDELLVHFANNRM